MKTLYLECASGISGDMTVAALLDLGADLQHLLRALDSLHLDGVAVHTGRVKKCGIDAYDFEVVIGAQEPHPHLHSYTHEHSHTHHHEEEPDLDEIITVHIPQTVPHHHNHSTHSAHVHRNLRDILEIIEHSEISGRAKTLSCRIFEIVAEAEAQAHGIPLDEVHFHEVGAVDSIVDIVATAVCIDNLGVGRVVTSPLYEGRGHVHCQHGKMPVPAPATAAILSRFKIPVILTGNDGEMVTPTGAAIVAALAGNTPPSTPFVLLKTGIGAGKREFANANILRAHLIESAAEAPETAQVLKKSDHQAVLIECNLDDMTPEQLSFAMEKLFEGGAADVWFTPVYMKKNRPSTLLSLLCMPEEQERMVDLLLTHTSTIGVRMQMLDRIVMERVSGCVATEYGEIEIKRCSFGQIEKTSVEYESAKKAAREHNVQIDKIYQAVSKQL